jgi:hypothetical protein
MLAIETGSSSALIFRFYRQNPWISSRAVGTDGSKNHIEIVSQRVCIVVLLQLSLRAGDEGSYHDQLSVNSGKTTNLLKPFRTHKTLKVTQERFMFLNLFFKSRALQCFLSLPQLTVLIRRPHCLRHLACVARIIETVLRRQEPIVDAHIERQSMDLRHQRRSEPPYEIAHGVEGRRQMQHATTYSTVSARTS